MEEGKEDREGGRKEREEERKEEREGGLGAAPWGLYPTLFRSGISDPQQAAPASTRVNQKPVVTMRCGAAGRGSHRVWPRNASNIAFDYSHSLLPNGPAQVLPERLGHFHGLSPLHDPSALWQRRLGLAHLEGALRWGMIGDQRTKAP